MIDNDLQRKYMWWYLFKKKKGGKGLINKVKQVGEKIEMFENSLCKCRTSHVKCVK